MVIFDSIKKFFKNLKSHVTSGVAFLLVVVFCVTTLTIQYFGREDAISPLTLVGAVIVPFQEGINEIGGFLFKSEEERINLNEAREKIEALQKENDELKRKNEELNALALENGELREILGAKERLTNYEMTEASVIGNDGVNSFRRFTVNKGSMDGIKVNMNVITSKGLVGIVTKTGLNYSIVTSIIEDGTNVSVMTKNGHENCIVTGDFSISGLSGLKLENALGNVDFSKDNTLITSYISDKYLPGLLVGYAEEVTDNADGLTKSGTVRTAVDFTKLHEVLIIKTMRDELREETK